MDIVKNLDTNNRFGEWVDDRKLSRIIYDNPHLRCVEFIDGKLALAAMSRDGQKKLNSMHDNGILKGYTVYFLADAFMAIQV